MSCLKTWKFKVLNPIHSSQFKRNVKVAKKRGKDMDKLRVLLILLLEEKPLPAEYLDHPQRPEI